MATILKFEDIIAWQKALELSDLIYLYSNNGNFVKDFGLRDQMRRASVSIVSNIAEGFERDGRNELINFLSFSKASAGETKSQLYRAFDRKYIIEKEFNECYNLADETAKKISNFIKYLNQSEFKGSKFKNRVN